MMGVVINGQRMSRGHLQGVGYSLGPVSVMQTSHHDKLNSDVLGTQ